MLCTLSCSIQAKEEEIEEMEEAKEGNDALVDYSAGTQTAQEESEPLLFHVNIMTPQRVSGIHCVSLCAYDSARGGNHLHNLFAWGTHVQYY